MVVAATAAGVALTRLVSLSKGPWDWDEVLFCLALNNYDVPAHQPHPAGFPLYVLLGRIAYFFTDTDFHALQAVNVLAGMALFPLMFFLARAFRFEFAGALGAGILFAFLPNVWFYGGTAFSDVPALALYLSAVLAYLSAGERTRRYLLAGVLLGAAMLIRPQNAVMAVFPWTIATVRLARAKRIGGLAAGNLALVLVVALGYGIAAWDSGFEPYYSAVTAHGRYVRSVDSAAGGGGLAVWKAFLAQIDPYDAGKASLLMNVLALAALIGGRRGVVAQVLLTFGPVFLFTMLAVNPLGASRFSLTYMPGVVLLAVEGTRALARLMPRWQLAFRVAILAALVGRFATWTLPAFETPRATLAPPSQAAQWLSRNVPESTTIFVEGNIWPWARYYLPRHKRVVVHDPALVVAHPGARDGWYLANETTSASGATIFRRPRNRTWNIVTQRCFDAYAMPAVRIAHFARGWHWQEGDANMSWRWSQKSAVIRLGPAGPKAELHLRFAVPHHVVQQPIRVTFTLNRKPIGAVVATKNDHEVRWVVDAHADRANVLGIEVDRSFVPAQYGSHDTRELGIMLQHWSWRRVD